MEGGMLSPLGRTLAFSQDGAFINLTSPAWEGHSLNNALCRLDAGPLVRGIPDALYESFTSFEEANMVFAREQALGRTRIVGGKRGQTVVRKDQIHNSPRASHSNTASSSCKNGSFKASLNPEYQQNNDQGSTKVSSRTVENSGSTQYGKSGSILRSSSEPSASFRRFQIIDSFFNDESTAVRVKVRVSSPLNTPALTPTAGVTSSPRSTSITEGSSTPRAVVKTPFWLAPYPKAPVQSSNHLSPLNNAGLSLKYFQDPTILAVMFDQAGTGCGGSNTPGSSIYLTPTKYTARDTTAIDPRSPLNNQTEILEPIFARQVQLIIVLIILY